MAHWNAVSEEVGAAVVPAHDKVEGSGYTDELVLGILLGRCPGERFEVVICLENELAFHPHFLSFRCIIYMHHIYMYIYIYIIFIFLPKDSFVAASMHRVCAPNAPLTLALSDAYLWHCLDGRCLQPTNCYFGSVPQIQTCGEFSHAIPQHCYFSFWLQQVIDFGKVHNVSVCFDVPVLRLSTAHSMSRDAVRFRAQVLKTLIAAVELVRRLAVCFNGLLGLAGAERLSDHN